MVKVVAGPNHNSKGESLHYGRTDMAINPLTKCDRQHRMAFQGYTHARRGAADCGEHCQAAGVVSEQIERPPRGGPSKFRCGFIADYCCIDTVNPLRLREASRPIAGPL